MRNEKECKFQTNAVNWLHSFTKIIENEGHEKKSIAKIHQCKNYCESSGDVNSSLACFTRDCILMSFEPQLCCLSFRHCKNSSMGHFDHCCFTESENSAVARDYGGPKSSCSLHVVCDTMDNHMSKSQVMTNQILTHHNMP